MTQQGIESTIRPWIKELQKALRYRLKPPQCTPCAGDWRRYARHCIKQIRLWEKEAEHASPT